MLTRIKIYLTALTFMLASCAKETFNFANTSSTFDKVKKDQQISPTLLASNTDNMVARIIEPNASKKFYVSTDKLSVDVVKSASSQALYQKPTSSYLRAQAASKVESAKITAKQTHKIKYFTPTIKERVVKGTTRGRNQIIAALLAYFFGGLGAHRFYLGYIRQGLLQLGGSLIGTFLIFTALLSVLFTASVPMSATFFIGLTILIAVYAWTLIDFIRILTGKLKPKNGEYTRTR